MIQLCDPSREELLWLIRQMRAPRLRSMSQFAEQEIVHATGPYKDRRFSLERQPFARILFAEIDSQRWKRFIVTGPSQSGKTLCGFVIPIMYHCFEIGETVIVGIPDMSMAGDKWGDDLKPMIEASAFKELLPIRGQGSKDGAKVEAITFRNGAQLRFMSGGGTDKKRAGKTGRVLVVTETDGLDSAGETSREADKISQLEARLLAFGDQARAYMECTLSTEAGRTWREYNAGSCSRLALPCPHCRVFVTPEREQLRGWQDAADEIEAREKSHLCCPSCGATWTDGDRIAANQGCRIIHKGQQLVAGEVDGELPRTDTLGFRWTAANNLLRTMGDEGVDEWKAARDPDEQNAERKQRQFHWTLPSVPDVQDLSGISVDAIKSALHEPAHDQGVLPEDTLVLAGGIDIGKWLLHYTVGAFDAEATTHVVDYGVQPVHSNEIGEERAVLTALRELREKLETGYGATGSTKGRSPRAVLFDAAGSEAIVKAAYAFAMECRARPGRVKFFLSKGTGTNQYRDPEALSDRVKWKGDGCQLRILESPTLPLMLVDDWYWKGYVHARVRTPKLQPGAFFIFKPPPMSNNPGRPNLNHHLGFAKALTAWKQVERVDEKRGRITEWIHNPGAKADHYFDAMKLACVAAHLCGIRVVQGQGKDKKPRKPKGAQGPGPSASDRGNWLSAGTGGWK